MSWFRKKKSDALTSKSSSSIKNNKSTTDLQLTSDTSTTIQNIATILVIGETGSGKSTFINYLTNYFLGGKYDKPRISIPTRYYPTITEPFGHCEKAIDDVTISKTDTCHQYLFRDPNTDKQYLFLDTPGLGDTRGVDQDQKNIDTILNAINNLQGLTSVIIVVNGSIARITTNFKSVLLALRGNLPDIVMDNVILILSHVKRHQSTFDIKKTLKMNGTTVYPYYMQNSAFAQDPKTWGSHEHKHIDRDWIESMEEIQQMLSTINTFQTKSVAAFDDMRTIRNAIKTCMHEARLEVTQVQRMHDEILIYEQAVKKYQGEEISYQDYTQDQTITVNELIDAPYHSTICTKCNFVCHQNCSLEETEETGNEIFRRCAAMNSENNCKNCPSNCSFTEHYHARKMMQTTEQTLTKVLYDIKAKFDIATKNKSNFQQKLNSAQDARKLMEQVLRQKITAIQAQCQELRKVCGSFNLAQELHTLVEQLRLEAQILTSLEARSQAEMAIRELNMFCQKLEGQEQNTKTSNSEMIVVDTGSGSDKTAAKFNSSTRNTVQESNEKVAAVERILEAQIKKKKTPVTITNSNDSTIYEPIDEADQEESQRQNRKSFTRSHPSVKMSTPNSQYGQICVVEPTTSKAKTSKYELLTIKELLDELHAAIAQNRSKVAIERELRNRAQGFTCPMITISDRAMFARYTNKYSHMNPDEISYRYLRLQRHINSQLGDDDMNIEKIATIPVELLIELAALYTLFTSKETTIPDSEVAEHQNNDYRRLSPPPLPPRAVSTPTRSHRSSSLQRDQRSMYQSNTVQESDYLEPIRRDFRASIDGNMNAPPSYDDAVRRRNEPLSQTSNGQGPARQRERQMNNSRSPDRKIDFATMTTDKLVELHAHARKSEDNIQQVAIYIQLEKRCNGEDKQLMTDPIMQQTLNNYQQLDTATLTNKFNALKIEIKKLTNGGDATKIKNIPKYILIKMTALTSILYDRSSVESTFF